ncbi:MAG: alpha/beta hydrolase [Bryobacteraceae bacterium]|nr:alpha/beta hydrolase [Bryobacteraceae bacterium]
MAATLSATGAAYQVIATERERRKHLPPGRLVDIGGFRLHINEQGFGTPTVVLEAGLTSMSAQWAWIQPELAKLTRVVSYDRAGLGWSDCCGDPRDARTAVSHLRRLLTAAGIPGPYLLVGHSLGGLLMRLFASEYREDVCGLVLVDSVHPEQRGRHGKAVEALHASFFRQLNLAAWLGPLGVIRFLNYREHLAKGLPDGVREVLNALGCWRSHLDSTAAEALNFDTICRQVRETGPFGDLPVAVITAETRGEGFTDYWHCLQKELASLSTNSSWTVVPGSDHVSLITNREHAEATIQAVRAILHGSA